MLGQGMVRERIRVRALAIEFLLRQRRIVACQRLFVLVAFQAFSRWARHGEVAEH